MKSQQSVAWLALIIMLVGTVLRLLPHPYNVTPLAAIALFGGAVFPRRWSLLVPLAAIIASDAVVGFHATVPFTWGAFVLIAVIGWWVRARYGWRRILVGSVLGSALFFLITNFGVWLMGHAEQWFPRTWAGLLECYAAGLPFYRQTLVGDVAYAAVFFGAYHLAAARLARPAAVVVSPTSMSS